MGYGIVKQVGDVHRMESKHVNWPDMVYIIDGLSMVLECIFLVLDLWTWVKVLYTNLAFNQANCIACVP